LGKRQPRLLYRLVSFVPSRRGAAQLARHQDNL